MSASSGGKGDASPSVFLYALYRDTCGKSSLRGQGDGSGPTARGGCACTTLGGSVVLFGGADRMAHVFSDVWLLEAGAEGYRWRPAPCSAEKGVEVLPRSGASLTLVGGKLYLFGGQDVSTGSFHSDLLCLDVETWRWSRVEIAGGPQPGARHSHFAGRLADNCMIVFGGVGPVGHMNDVWIFNADQRGWTCPHVSSPKPAAREMHAGAMLDETTLLVYGGRCASGRVLDDAAVFDAKEMVWRSIEPTPFARCAHSAVAMPRADVLGLSGDTGGAEMRSGSHVVVVYGGFSGEAVEGDVFYIDPFTSEVEVLCRGPRRSNSSAAVVPSLRFAHAAAAVPSQPGSPFSTEMVVFGGVNPEEDLNDIAALRCGSPPVDSGGDQPRAGPPAEGPPGPAGAETSTIRHGEGLVEIRLSERGE